MVSCESMKKTGTERGPKEFGKAGGDARAVALTPEERIKIASRAGRSGGPARAAALTKEQRREIASNAAKARWGKKKKEE